MHGILTANLKAAKSSYTATAVAIALAVAFLLACLGLAGGVKVKMGHNLAHNVTGAEMVATISEGASADAKPGQPGILDRVAAALANLHPEWQILTRSPFFARVSKQKFSNHTEIMGLAQPRFDPGELTKGTRPAAENQIGLDASVAKTLRAKLQDQVSIEVYDPAKNYILRHNLTVSGIYQSRPGAFPTVYVTNTRLQLWLGKTPDSNLLLVASPHGELNENNAQAQASTEIKQLAAKYAQPGAIVVQPVSRYISDQVDKTVGGNGLLAILLIFPTIAAVTAVIVVSVTYNVLLARRRRSLALLRAVGATKGQLRGLILKETVLLGAVSAILGVLIGVPATGIINHQTALTRTWEESFGVITWQIVLACFGAGVAISVLAGYVPARQVSKVTPMQALAEEDPYDTVHRRRVFKTISGTILFLAGTTGMILSTLQNYRIIHAEHADTSIITQLFLLAMLCGAISFIGLLLLTSIVLPYFTAALGKLSSKKAVTWRLAAENTRRNPRRTGATGAALTLGVTLVVMLLTGASSMQATAQRAINAKKPLDFILVASSPLTRDTIDKANKVQNIEKVIKVPGLKGTVTIDTPDKDKYNFPYSGENTTILAADVAADSIARAPLTHAKPGQIVIPKLDKHLRGKTVTVTSGNKTLKLKALPGNLAFPQLHANDLAKLRSPENVPYTRALYLRIKDNISSAQVEQIASDLMALNPEIELSSEAFMRVMLTEMLQAIMWTTVTMMGISIVVSLVGVANTLGLSVLERRRENGLLRALGMTKGRMRIMLLLEALLLGIGGGVVGMIAGIGYAVAGLYALPVSFDDASILVQIPSLAWGVIAVIVLVAMLASVWPARNATKVSPVEALAHD